MAFWIQYAPNLGVLTGQCENVGAGGTELLECRSDSNPSRPFGNTTKKA